jgi:uncharacterized protein YegL
MAQVALYWAGKFLMERRPTMDDLQIRQEDLVQNPTPRVPICLCLDTSYSMVGDKIRELNEGVRLFFDAIQSDEVAKYAAEICVVAFGDVVRKKVDFASIERQNVPELVAEGGTPMGEGIDLALSLLEQRKGEYSSAGVDYFQPWLVLMTDGEPTDYIDSAAQRVSQLVSNRKLTVFPIGIGDDADLGVLAKFSPSRPPLRLRGLNFKEFFEWLSQSVSRVSQSTPGEKVELDMAAIKGWAEL